MPLQGDVHGCPYKTMEKDALTAALTRMRIAPQFVSEAVSKAKGGHFQLACAVTFEGQHGGCACETGINHPNQVGPNCMCALSESTKPMKPWWCPKLMPQSLQSQFAVNFNPVSGVTETLWAETSNPSRALWVGSAQSVPLAKSVRQIHQPTLSEDFKLKQQPNISPGCD